MKPKDKENTIRRYEERFRKFGVSVKTMGWRDKSQQNLRFTVLSGIGDLNLKTVLDVGCGFGDLYGYLAKSARKVKYTGYDISPKIIRAAEKRFPGASFEIKDILEERVQERFDYVFSSGVFNHRISENLTFTKRMIKKMFEISKKGLAFNMMTDYVDFRERRLFYYSPEGIFKFAKNLSRYVILRHDYPLYEFTIYVYKEK